LKQSVRHHLFCDRNKFWMFAKEIESLCVNECNNISGLEALFAALCVWTIVPETVVEPLSSFLLFSAMLQHGLDCNYRIWSRENRGSITRSYCLNPGFT